MLGWVEKLGRYADVSIRRGASVTPGVVAYRIDDRVFFANASYVKGRVQKAVRGAPTPHDGWSSTPRRLPTSTAPALRRSTS